MAGLAFQRNLPVKHRFRGKRVPPRLGIVHAGCVYRAVEDVLGRVDVRISLETAVDALEDRLALTVLQCDMAATVAGLGRVRRVDQYEPGPGETCLVFEFVLDIRPTVAEDTAFNPALAAEPLRR